MSGVHKGSCGGLDKHRHDGIRFMYHNACQHRQAKWTMSHHGKHGKRGGWHGRWHKDGHGRWHGGMADGTVAGMARAVRVVRPTSIARLLCEAAL